MLFKENNFGYTIEADSIEEKKKKLDETLSDIQLVYAENLLHESNSENKTFSEILNNINSRSLTPLRETVEAETGEGATREMLEANMKKYLSEIDKIYKLQCSGKLEDDFESILRRLEPIKEYIKNVRDESRKAHPEAWAKLQTKEEERANKTEHAGILTIAAGPLEKYDENTRTLLESKGSNKHEMIIDVQLPEMFATNQKFSRETLNDSFEKLADIIIDKYPETSAIAGHSWLFSSPGYKKIAPFEVLGKDTFLNWNQLIDKDGNIHKERFNNFIKTGELPYESLFAYMKTEDFLKKFSKRHGMIKLKELNPRWLNETAPREEAAKAEGAIFEKTWADKKIKTEEDIDQLFESMPASKQRLQHAGLYEDFLHLLKTNIGLSIRELGEKKVEILKDFREKLAQSVEQDKYIDKEVHLDEPNH